MKQQDPNFDLNDWNTVLQLMSRHKFVFIVDDSRRAEFISEQVSQVWNKLISHINSLRARGPSFVRKLCYLNAHVFQRMLIAIQALLSGSIPIYWGGFSVKEVLPRKDAIMTVFSPWMTYVSLPMRICITPHTSAKCYNTNIVAKTLDIPTHAHDLSISSLSPFTTFASPLHHFCFSPSPLSLLSFPFLFSLILPPFPLPPKHTYTRSTCSHMCI